MTTQSATKTQTITAKEILVTCYEVRYQYDEINNIETELEDEYTVEVYEFPNGTILVPGTDTHDWFFISMDEFEPNGTDRLGGWQYTGDTLVFEPKELIESAYGSKSEFGDYSAISQLLKLVSVVQVVEFHLERLELDTDTDPCSGLRAEDHSEGIKLYDDHASGVYDASKLVKILENLSEDEVTLESDSSENVWELISPAAI